MTAHADDLARLRAEADQSREQMRELGRNLHAFYLGAAEAGFAPSDALALTQTFLAESIRSAPAAGMAETADELMRRMIEGGGE